MSVNTGNQTLQTTPVIEQEKFYNDKSSTILLFFALLIAFAVGLGGLVFLLRSTTNPAPTYFSATDQQQLIVEAPLDQPDISENVLLNWVVEGMMAANTFNFMNYSRVMDNVSSYFTPEGYETYKNVLTQSKVIDRVVGKKLVLKAMATDAPQVLIEQPLAGRYLWKILAPMRFRYQNVTTDVSDQVEITLVVMRVPTTQSPNGVLILKYDMVIKGRS